MWEAGSNEGMEAELYRFEIGGAGSESGAGRGGKGAVM